MLHPLYDDVLRELAARYDPTVDDIDAPGTLYDDTAIFQILQGWREGVWRNAELLAAADTLQQRRAAAEYIENYALGMARMIKAGTTISDSSARDAHCAAYRREPSRAGWAGRGEDRQAGAARPAGRHRADPGRVPGAGARLRRARWRSPAAGGGWRGPRRLSLRAGESRVLRVRLTKRARRRARAAQAAGGPRHGVVAVAMGHHADGRGARPR